MESLELVREVLQSVGLIVTGLALFALAGSSHRHDK